MKTNPTRSAVEIKDWQGLITAADAHDLPHGAAQSQLNLQCLNAGSLTARPGIRKSSTYSGSTSNDIISQFTYQSPLDDWIVTVDTNGDIKARKSGTIRTLASGVSTFAPWYFTRTRKGDLIGVNGIDRGIRWDGITSAAEELGITGPTSACSVAEDTGGGSLTNGGTYICWFRYIDNTTPTPVVSSITTASASVTISTASSRIDWSSIPQSSEDRVSHIELWRSLPGAPNRLYYVATIADGTTTYADDGTSDNDLIAAAAADNTKKLDIILPNNEVNARRFTPPPKTKAVPVWFQDRLHFIGDVRYDQGTVATGGNTTLTGTGTAWSTDLAGRYVHISGESTPILISSVGSATSITLATAAATTASGLSYVILPSEDERNSMFFSSPDEPEAVLTTNIITPQENTGDNDDFVGAFAFGSVMYLLKERHIYTYTFIRQPIIDADSRLIAERGAINNRCVAIHEGTAYIMDTKGVYRMSLSGAVTPISQAIQDYFRPEDSPLDWANKKWFHASIDPQYELVRFHVGFTADSSTRPQRALVYHIRSGVWWTEKYPDEIGGASLIEVSGERRLVFGGQSDRVYLANEGETDYVSSATTGTVTSATSTTLTDSTATFGTSDELVGAPVAITSGTGKTEYRQITSHTNTQLTVASWGTTPAAGDTYKIGAIEYQWKGGIHRQANVENNNARTIELLTRVASSAATMDVRLYHNRSATAQNFGVTIASSPGESCATTAGDPDAVLDLTDTSGYHTVDQAGVNYEGFKKSNRFVEVEFRGFKTERFEIYQATFEGLT